MPDRLGHLNHLGLDVANHAVDGQSGLEHFLEKHPCEQAVGILVLFIEPIERLLPGAGREDHHLARCGLWRRQAASAQRSARAAGLDRAVAAGIDDGQAKARLALAQVIQNSLQRNGFVPDLLGRAPTDIDRQQVIGSAQLHPVACEKYNHFITALNIHAEVSQGFFHAPFGQIESHGYLESGRFQRFGHGPGIGPSIDQGGDVLIRVIADHQCDAAQIGGSLRRTLDNRGGGLALCLLTDLFDRLGVACIGNSGSLIARLAGAGPIGSDIGRDTGRA